MNATETIKEIIRNKVAVINEYIKSGNVEGETFERIRHELVGMMICFRNICEDDNAYCINYYEDGVEFGYYDEHGRWFTIEK